MSGVAAIEARALLERLIAEAESAFSHRPKALWSDRTYLAPKDAAKLKQLLGDGSQDEPRSVSA